MKNRELFQRDPVSASLVNDGQARIQDIGSDANARAVLRYELEHFVCEGEYASGIQRILDSFLASIGGNQAAAWISGFFGSGKSHLEKMIEHLWINTIFPEDGAKARSLPPELPSDIQAALLELDNQGRRAGGLHAASGTLPEGSGESVRLTVLNIILRSCGLPTAYPQAKLCLYLRNQGFFDDVKADVEAAGKDFLRELNDLYVSPHLRRALIKRDPGLGDERAVRELLRNQFPMVSDIDTTEFIRITREVLSAKSNGELPLTIVVLDEVQQFIAGDPDRATKVVEVAEALNKNMDGRVLLVGAGQSALGSDTPQFGKLRDRFTIPVELSDADVEAVTRKVLLRKKPEKLGDIQTNLDSHSGEIDRHLTGSKIAPRSADRDVLVKDYPILPSRRRFWESAQRAVDPTGASSLLRTQLRMTHEALRDIAESDVGTVIPGDFLFDQQRAGMVQKGVLLPEINNLINQLDDGTDDGRLTARLCGLVFLIRKLSREPGADIGVRATPEMLADLLVADLGDDGATLRRSVPDILKKLADDGVLIFDHGEYNLQTKESSEWEKEFKNRQAQITADTSGVQHSLDTLLRGKTQSVIGGIKLKQGDSNTPREIALHFGDDVPSTNGKEIPVWIRDAWNCSEKQVLDAARAAGTDSPMLFVFIPKAHEVDLPAQLIRSEAAKSTLDFKGEQSTREGEDARSAMETRKNLAEGERNRMVSSIVEGAKVFKGGGTELFQLSLEEKVRDGSEDALVRLFPRFKESDHKKWPSVMTRAKNRDDSPLEAIGWKNPTEQHPVCKEILSKAGSGMEGGKIRAELRESPLGWPQDAIDGALMALHTTGHLTVKDKSGASLSPGQLDQNKISKAQFRVESTTIPAAGKIKLRALFQDVGVSAKPSDDLGDRSTEYLDTLQSLASRAGGDPPLPEQPSSKLLAEIRALSGNDRLAKILKEHDSLKQNNEDWKKAADLTDKRMPVWQQLEKLLSHGPGVEDLKEVIKGRDSIVSSCLLLDSTDHVTPLIKKAASSLRSAASDAHNQYCDEREKLLADLQAGPNWQALEKGRQAEILKEEGIHEVPTIEVGSDPELLSSLDQTPLSSWSDKTDALPSRFAHAAEKAAKELQPKARRVSLPSRTINKTEELDAWVEDVRKQIEEGLKDGPVIV